MAAWAEWRERDRIRLALQQGKPVPSEEYDNVRKVLHQVRWYRPMGVCFAILSLTWLYLALLGHGSMRWVGTACALSFGVMALIRFWQYKRISGGAAKWDAARSGRNR